MSFAAAPFSLWGLAWVAIAPLWVMSVRQTAPKLRPAFAAPVLLPLTWGIAYHGSTLFWLTGLHPLTWMGVPWVASVAVVAFAWSFITLWGAACVCGWAWVMRWMGRQNVPSSLRVLVGTALWCGSETVRQWTPLDWTALSFTQSPHNLAILHLGQISGAMTVTAAIVAVNGLLAEAWLRRDGTAKALFISAIALFLVLHVAGFTIYSQALSNSSAIKIGIVQGNVPTRIKLFKDGLKKALDGYSTGYRNLVDQGVDVVLTPEGALPFLWRGVKRQNPVYEAILEKRIPAWIGTFMPAGTYYTQSLIALTPNGEAIGQFNKVKLVPLGEYIPFESTIGQFIGRLSPVKSSMLPGRFDQQFETSLGRGAVGICYESAFPELFRSQVAAGAKFLITASNLDPYSPVLMAQHQAHDVMRAIETDRWMVRATNTGYSGIVDPHGQIQWRSQPYQYQIHVGTIYPRQSQTLYVLRGDWLTPALLVSSAIALGLNRGWQRS
ncbi:apolipoprotein N-acyltransferase [Myxacorys almedinensis A]|uniref:Apolipoprotein N-acyltransferase n=2 Tax=Myxacorys TaxID=2056239 RepID=A0A8J7Z081_9CYAN|nr:apolipoprotein N-acyltransferase [Myxacorys almedinensis A]